MKANYAAKRVLIKTIRSVIERLETPKQADQLEEYICQACSGHLIDDATVLEMLRNIETVRTEQGWNK